MAKANQEPAGEESGSGLSSIRVREHFHTPVRAACKRLGVVPTEFVNQAVREKLEREGFWPEDLAAEKLSSLRDTIIKLINETLEREGLLKAKQDERKD